MKKTLLLLLLIPSLAFSQTNGVQLSNFSTSGSFGLTNVDSYSRMYVNQTTPSITLTIPTPSNTTTKTTEMWIGNRGTVALTLIPGGVIDTGKFVIVKWIGGKYSVSGSKSIGTNIDSTQYIRRDGTSAATTGPIQIGNGVGFDVGATGAVQFRGTSTGTKELKFLISDTPYSGRFSVYRDGATLVATDGTSTTGADFTLTNTGLKWFKFSAGQIAQSSLDMHGYGIRTNLFGAYGYFRTDNLSGLQTWQMPDSSGTVALKADIKSGTVTSVSVVSANGVSGTVATSTTTPAITLILGAITPASVNTPGTIVGSNISSGGNTTGNAATATALQTARNINGVAFDGTAPITITAAPSGTAGGSLAGTYPNPTIASNAVNLTTMVTGLLPDANISSAAVWNAKVSSQWTTTATPNIYYPNGVMIGGTGDPATKLSVIETSTSTLRGISSYQYSSTGSAQWNGYAAGGTPSSPTAVVNGRVLTNMNGGGYDGSTMINSGSVRITAAGTVSIGVVPSIMELRTTNGSGVLGTGLKIDSVQNVQINNNVTKGNWQASIINPTYGGTGVNNGTFTNTLSGNFATTGAFNLTFSVPRSTTYGLPNTSGDILAGVNTAQTFSATNTFSVTQKFSSSGYTINDGTSDLQALNAPSAGTIKIGNGATTLQFGSTPWFTAVSTSISFGSAYVVRANSLSSTSSSNNMMIGTVSGYTGSGSTSGVRIGGIYNGASYTTSATSGYTVNPTPGVEIVSPSNTGAGGTGSIAISTGANTGGGTQGNVTITGARIGLRNTSPSAYVHIGAGDATLAPLLMTSGTVLTTPVAGAIEYNGKFYATPASSRYEFILGLTASAVIDFPSIASGSNNTQTVTVTGVADGDAVSIGWTNSAANTSVKFIARCSAANTVSITGYNDNTVTAMDPGSGTFTIKVLK